jgi:hypothetical protein
LLPELNGPSIEPVRCWKPTSRLASMAELRE